MGTVILHPSFVDSKDLLLMGKIVFWTFMVAKANLFWRGWYEQHAEVRMAREQFPAALQLLASCIHTNASAQYGDR